MRRPHRKAHGLAWRVLLVALPVIVLAALILRQDPSDAPPNERIAPPADAGGEG